MPKPVRLCVVKVRAKIIDAIRLRYPDCPFSVDSVFLYEHKDAVKEPQGIKWSWHTWVHGLPLRVSSWSSLDDCAEKPCEFRPSSDNGGTPGFADLFVIGSL